MRAGKENNMETYKKIKVILRKAPSSRNAQSFDIINTSFFIFICKASMNL